MWVYYCPPFSSCYLFSSFPPSPPTLQLTQEGLSDWQGAVNDYSQAISLWGGGRGEGINPFVLTFRGNALTRLGRYKDALQVRVLLACLGRFCVKFSIATLLPPSFHHFLRPTPHTTALCERCNPYSSSLTPSPRRTHHTKHRTLRPRPIYFWPRAMRKTHYSLEQTQR